MRAIFTSDWQAEVENLDLCRKASHELLHHCRRFGVEFVVHCGDLKRPYNPLDGRMINAVADIIWMFKKHSINWIQLLGNHDRFGLHTDKENWLSILENAGAVCYEDPDIVSLSGGNSLALLPFRQSNVLLKREAFDLAKAVNGQKKPVLVFHADLNLARYNVKTSSQAEISVGDLAPERYAYCIGGHIHLQQNVAKNVFYVGSPFATDWGEANQLKGYLMYDWETGKLSSLPSHIPGMFDPTWPMFPSTKKDWKGAKVRIHVECDGTNDIFSTVQKAKVEAQKKYVGAEIVAVPELREQETNVTLKAQDSDEQKIRTFVVQTLDSSLGHAREKIVKYLVRQLEKTGSIARRTGKFQFMSARAMNFLSFEKLQVEYVPGLTVVSGVNEDRRGKSNGSGKTSFLSPPSVALFGTTFKGQKHDHWMHRWVSKSAKSWVDLTCVNQGGKKGRVARGRKPKFLRLWVEGKEVAAGNRPEQVQEAVEQFTGFTWETLANAIFVDQRRTNLMLVGTETERKQFLSRLQGLGRFEKAALEIKEDLAAVQRKVQEVNIRVSSAEATCNACKQSLYELKQETPDVAKLKNVLASKVTKLEHEKKRFIEVKEKAAGQLRALGRKLEEAGNSMMKLERRKGEIDGRIASLNEKIKRLSSLEAECPTCEQSVDQAHRNSVVESLEELRDGLKEESDKLLGAHANTLQFLPKIRNKINDLSSGQEEIQDWIEQAREQIATLREQLREAQNKEQKLKLAEGSLERAKHSVEVVYRELQKALQVIPIYEYCVWAFSKKGMPAFLNAQLCPILNKAAAFYSQVFSEKEIQVVFSVTEDGDANVQVVNAHGGSDINDQSQGEMRIASIITSFALRHVAPQTNLLILDEPGEGLDPLAARIFARGLKQIVSRFGSVFVVTHNQAILSELAGERHLVIRKKNRVSLVEARNVDS